MKHLRRALLAGVVVAAAAGIAFAQAPPLNAGVVGWLQAIYNQLNDGGNGNPRTPIAASSGNVAAATAAATLPGVAGKTTFISGFQMTAGGSTAVSSVTCTVSPVGSGGSTLSYTFSTSATVDSPSNPLVVTFNPPLPANAANTAIVATCPALGAGNAHAAMSAEGYQR